jgi:cation:H+ antiporter
MLELNLLTALLLIAGGFVLLCKSADMLVDGAVFVADRLGISPMIIGLTVVSVGTSAPELAASIAASASGNGSIAVGNVMGSNIANIALIGGLCALIRPIAVNVRMLKVELPVMIGAFMVLLPLIINGVLTRLEGLVLFGLFLGLLFLLIKNSRKESVKVFAAAKVPEVSTKVIKHRTLLNAVAFIFLGLAGLTLGAKMVLSGAVYTGRLAGMSEAVIGLTIIAVGTSLPELITCLAASYKKQDDISVGNLVGSNLFNTLLVIGAAALVRPLSVEKVLIVRDFPVMAAVSILFVLLAIKHRTVGRTGGAALLIIYTAYVGYLIVTKSG